MKVLVTGGAGYIGSHVVKLLGEKGYDLLIVDNLINEQKEAVLYGKLIEIDVGNTFYLKEILKEFNPDIVIYFAAFIEVAESVIEPAECYINNTFKLLKH